MAAASTTNVTLPTITGTQLDGVTLAATSGVGRRVLLKDQTTTSQNGIYYVVSQIAGTSFTLARALDMDTWSEVPGSYVWVEEGTVNADTGWVCTSDLLTGGVLRVIGTDAMVWTQFSGAGTITAGAGLTKTGNTLDVVGGTGLTVAADLVSLTVPVTVVNGGTGQTTAKAARETGMGAAGYYSSATHSAGTTISITQATHGLRASRGLIVQAQDEATGAVEWPDIVVAATGDVTVTYAASVAANAKRITVIG